jgi:hypothetical protein
LTDESNVHQLPARVTRARVTIEQLRGRLGHFSISDESVQCWPDLVLLVMGQVIVLQAGRCHHGSTVYLAISQQFAEIGDAEKAPMYEWVYDKGAMRAKRLQPAGSHGA